MSEEFIDADGVRFVRREVDRALLASVMRKVLMSEDMYVQDDDRLLLDGHVHGGITPDELAAVRAVLAERRASEDHLAGSA